MPKVVATLQVEDGVKWEEGFRTHAELFRSQVDFQAHPFCGRWKRCVICFEPDDVIQYFKVLNSPATEEAMAFDGVKRETVKISVLDKEFEV